ncbi:ribonuclease P protein component [bacterium]|nr:ribonuclease P protein component [bacterium]
MRRFAVVVPKAVAANAVRRNYARRRIREYFRRNKIKFPAETDMLLKIYKYPKDWNRFFSSLETLLHQVEHRAMENKRSETR